MTRTRRTGPTDPKRSSTASSDDSASEPEFVDDDSEEDHKPRRARGRASRAASGSDANVPIIARLPARRVRVRVGGELLPQQVTVPAREVAVRVRVRGASSEPNAAELSEADY